MIRWCVRLVLLALAVVLAVAGPVPGVLGRLFPSLSPLAVLSSSLAQRRWFLGLLWGAPALLVLLAASWKGMIFCRWVCPAGTIYTIPARWSLRKDIIRFRPNGVLFWAILSSAAVGVPVLVFLDPLSSFHRLTPLLTGAWTAASLVPGVVLPLALVLGAIQPLVWCGRICPLGYLFELAHSLRRGGPGSTFRRDRRQMLGGLAVGVPLGLVTRRFLLGREAYAAAPILPPGAADAESFAAACQRCYACVAACPARIIRVGAPRDRPLGQFFQPEVRFYQRRDRPGWGFCPESCRKCTQVCPAGAIAPLTLQDKRHRQIGVAEVVREACLAWAEGQHCIICQDECPYSAIDMEYSPMAVPGPVVKEDACRGCGICQVRCPAVRAGKAIIVRGVRQQRQLPQDKMDSNSTQRA